MSPKHDHSIPSIDQTMPVWLRHVTFLLSLLVYSLIMIDVGKSNGIKSTMVIVDEQEDQIVALQTDLLHHDNILTTYNHIFPVSANTSLKKLDYAIKEMSAKEISKKPLAEYINMCEDVLSLKDKGIVQ